jgi:hypothetical protein
LASSALRGALSPTRETDTYKAWLLTTLSVGADKEVRAEGEGRRQVDVGLESRGRRCFSVILTSITGRKEPLLTEMAAGEPSQRRGIGLGEKEESVRS